MRGRPFVLTRARACAVTSGPICESGSLPGPVFHLALGAPNGACEHREIIAVENDDKSVRDAPQWAWNPLQRFEPRAGPCLRTAFPCL